MTAYITTKCLVYVLFTFVLVSFLSNTALINLLEDDEGQHTFAKTQPTVTSRNEYVGLKHLQRPVPQTDHDGRDVKQTKIHPPKQRVPPDSLPPYGSCAILLFGLPRAFREYVLPSLVQNVVRTNRRYGCDYFVHYYHIDKEESNGRSGRGGMIHPDDIQLLKTAVADMYKNNGTASGEIVAHIPLVSIVHDTNQTFWEKRQTQLMTYRNTRNANGKLTYFPYTEPTYVYPGTIDNIVKQWHSIDAVWNLMQKHENNKATGQRYQRVAMMRSDVVYITPVDVFAIPTIVDSTHSDVVIIPDFAKYPINDRMIIGPYDAVKLWATERFLRIDHYATKVAPPGTAMHSETFLNDTILTSIRSDLHLPIYEDPWLCFLRARADGAIWIEDCDAAKSGNGGGFPEPVLPYLKPFLNESATCRQRWLRDPVRRVKEFFCRQGRTPGESLTTGRERMLQKRARPNKQHPTKR
ncbi:hypothetical protein IV203_021839 [Nitzschia inconspicua]|uniref:Uncharacterized protein n=1 Tax=Nitzschia inconspicua TaxID=303405 RepID=A0A9K3KIF3_9STRA|nr:hypothetical protein IV203_033455 [Nitzschia inconspicua]KAG7343831.1 hypothetical protein IV203_021839 [Nitzschia inconspicua]